MITVKEEFLAGDKAQRAIKLGGAEPIVVWLALKRYAAANLTNGFIPDEDFELMPELRLLKHPRKALQVLVGCGKLNGDGSRDAGLVDPTPNGWQLHDYLDHANDADREAERRQRERDRKALYRAGQHGTVPGTTRDMSQGQRLDTARDIGRDVPRDLARTPGTRLPRPRPQPNPTQPEILAAAESQDLTGYRASAEEPEIAAAAAAESGIQEKSQPIEPAEPPIRGVIPARRQAPTSQPAALAMPLAERARAVLEDPGNASWSTPQNWPEVVMVAEALAKGAGHARPRLGDSRGDAGVRRVLQHFVDGWDPRELATLAGAVGRSQWWRGGGSVKGLSSLTTEVLRRAQNERAPTPPHLDRETAREIERMRAMTAGIGSGGT